ncbi:dehydratase [Rhodococcus sp. EPR-157]|uniref:MaoC family dehydratase n=1 Tax=Rhodococcus sp. EPR-157 TaxID=1813677 RepID=UPI0007BB290F|nr:MaoC family dehydratase [Rhodococcus sp. EPR-157]KZF13199.1 dehydratase [Rhodococcus sp. EPR-157]
MSIFTSADHLRQAKGADLGTSSTIEMSQARIDQFAVVTNDEQWIHVDTKRAAQGPFGTTIAHGFLTLSLLAPFLSDLIEVQGATSSINYGLNRVRFSATVPSGSALRAQGRILDIVDRTGAVDVVVEVTISVKGSDKPACVAESIIRYTF